MYSISDVYRHTRVCNFSTTIVKINIIFKSILMKNLLPFLSANILHSTLLIVAGSVMYNFILLYQYYRNRKRQPIYLIILLPILSVLLGFLFISCNAMVTSIAAISMGFTTSVTFEKFIMHICKVMKKRNKSANG